MRKFMIVVTMLVISASCAFAANFAPTPMVLSAEPTVSYAFDDSALDITVNVAGAAGEGVLMIYTKDAAESVDKVQNGHLGWHFVNKVDTCLFVSESVALTIGNNVMSWDGMDADGGKAPATEYQYYIYAFDNTKAKEPCTRQVPVNGWTAPDCIITVDDDGNGLVNPILYQSGNICCDDASDPTEKTHMKWIIGGDPDDATLVETTSIVNWRSNCRIDFLPTDHTMWFISSEKPSGIIEISKNKWVPNGASILQTDWAEEGIFEWLLPEKYVEYHFSVVIPVGAPDLIFPNMNHQTTYAVSDLVYLDLEDGSLVDQVDLAKWWVNVEEGAQYDKVATVGGPTDLYPGKNGELSLNAHGTCLCHVIDPYRDGDIDDKTLYINDNGDSFLDTNWQTDAERPWACNDPWVAIYKYGMDLDVNNFGVYTADGAGAFSFGLLGPDGTAAGYHAYYGETENKGKRICHIIDYDSAYDGQYCGNLTTSEDDRGGLWYVAHDSIKGVITNGPVSVDSAPGAFSVAQNSPNPFNPTTTIGFSVPEAGSVTVDVFNVAGQKIETIANDFMSAGSHSVTWNAAGYSAGIYFYTVKAGDFSKTMKMSLIK